MQSGTKTCVRFKTRFGFDSKSMEIKDVQEAVAYGLKEKMRSFQTYEISSVVTDGKVFSAKPENLSGTHHLHVDKVLTAADVVAYCEAELMREDKRLLSRAESFFSNPRPYPEELQGLTPEEEDRVFLAFGTLSLRDKFKTYPPDQLFFDNPFGRGGEFERIKPGDKVYNKSGQQIWPSTRPAPRRKFAPRF